MLLMICKVSPTVVSERCPNRSIFTNPMASMEVMLFCVTSAPLAEGTTGV